jgi:hypothetical protein
VSHTPNSADPPINNRQRGVVDDTRFHSRQNMKAAATVAATAVAAPAKPGRWARLKARFTSKKKQGEAAEMSLLNQYGGQIMKSLPILSSDSRHPMWAIAPEARNMLVQEYRSSGSLTKALDKVDVLLATNVAAVKHHIANLGELTTTITLPHSFEMNIETGFCRANEQDLSQ